MWIRVTKILSFIVSQTDLDTALAGTHLVIEAVPEDLALKKDLFRHLGRSCPEDVILATNTSALSITTIAEATRRPERVVGTHFFNPAHRMKLVEIISGAQTSQETVARTTRLLKRMGKESVVVKDSRGFITSRINVLIGNKAFNILNEGVASAPDIDKALKLGLNHPMGPFELVDLVGLDVRLSVLKDLHEQLGDKFRPSPLLVEYVQAGRLGKKVGQGVYQYDQKGSSNA